MCARVCGNKNIWLLFLVCPRLSLQSWLNQNPLISLIANFQGQSILLGLFPINYFAIHLEKGWPWNSFTVSFFYGLFSVLMILVQKQGRRKAKEYTVLTSTTIIIFSLQCLDTDWGLFWVSIIWHELVEEDNPKRFSPSFYFPLLSSSWLFDCRTMAFVCVCVCVCVYMCVCVCVC